MPNPAETGKDSKYSHKHYWVHIFLLNVHESFITVYAPPPPPPPAPVQPPVAPAGAFRSPVDVVMLPSGQSVPVPGRIRSAFNVYMDVESALVLSSMSRYCVVNSDVISGES